MLDDKVRPCLSTARHRPRGWWNRGIGVPVIASWLGTTRVLSVCLNCLTLVSYSWKSNSTGRGGGDPYLVKSNCSSKSLLTNFVCLSWLFGGDTNFVEPMKWSDSKTTSRLYFGRPYSTSTYNHFHNILRLFGFTLWFFSFHRKWNDARLLLSTSCRTT